MRLILHSLALVLIQSAALASGLNGLATVSEHTSHRASSADPTGGNDDSLVTFVPGETRVLLDVNGPGCINHLWFTAARFPNHPTFLRDIVIRMYWENSPVPSVEVPLGDFFALGHARQYPVTSSPICVGDNPKALNCYWPMPFRTHARIELYNNGLRTIRRVYFNIDYELGPVPADQGLFHAAFRRDAALRSQAHERNLTGKDNYVILETEGRGQYVGCALFVDAQPGGWWGEGDDMIFVDHSERPTMTGTGSEDYFCNAWGFQKVFSNPFYGCPLLEELPDGSSLTAVYRWHIPDPVRFRKHICVTIEHLFNPKVVNDYSSVAYWYQTEPVKRRDPLPRGAENEPRPHTPPATQPAQPAVVDMSGTELEAALRADGLKVRSVTANLAAGYLGGGYLEIELPDKRAELDIPVPCDGSYRVRLRPVGELIRQSVTAQLVDGNTQTITRRPGHQRTIPLTDLGTTRSTNRTIKLILGGDQVIGIDQIRVEPTDVQPGVPMHPPQPARTQPAPADA